ncbi:T-complex 10 C-terminal domain-containing protein [Streptomyces iakyrus]|uniref:T-complex 10 C-terminal domain-containing protein n=1 Tax=Streptomyces iakyrus TaxID=68219 RepID=UPI0036C9887D
MLPGSEGHRIESVSVVHGPWEVRVHRVDAPPGTPVREGGWAVADDTGPPLGRTGPGRALARRADGLTSTIVGLHGWRDAGAAVAHAVGANAYGHHSATPYLTLPAHPGGTHVLVTLVVLSADPEVNGGLETNGGLEMNGGLETNGDPYARGSGTRVRVAVSGEVEIRFPDGTRERVPR